MVFLHYALFVLSTLLFLFCALDCLLGLGMITGSFIARYVPEARQRGFRLIAGTGFLLMAASVGMRLFAPLIRDDVAVYAVPLFAAGALILAAVHTVFLCRKK